MSCCHKTTINRKSNIFMKYFEVISRQILIKLAMTFFQLLDELQKELEELRKYKIESEKSKSTRSRNPSLSDSNGYTPLQAEMAKLREVSINGFMM